MNCQSFENVVNELARDQIMDASIRDQAMLHCEGCKTCAAKLDDHRKLAQSLKQLATALRTMHAPVSLEENLLFEFRAQKPGNRVVRRSAWRLSWQYAAAAAIVVTLCGGAAIWWATERPAGETVATFKEDDPRPIKEKDPPVSATPSNGGVPAEKAQPAPSPKSGGKRSPKASSPSKGVKRPTNLEAVAVNRPTQEAEIATDFLPIGYGVQNVQEGGQLIRVELPRYAMARFGLPVNMDRYDERVKADVLLGADGLARAIRFVQ